MNRDPAFPIMGSIALPNTRLQKFLMLSSVLLTLQCRQGGDALGKPTFFHIATMFGVLNK